MLKISGIHIMHTVPALLLVEARKTYIVLSAGAIGKRTPQWELTSMKGNGDSEMMTASKLVMQKHCGDC